MITHVSILQQGCWSNLRIRDTRQFGYTLTWFGKLCMKMWQTYEKLCNISAGEAWLWNEGEKSHR